MARTSGVHLLQIHPLPDSDAETDVDIIAIHGLDTRSPDTWIWKSKGPDNNVNWLADKCMLPSRVGQARIFTCDWPSDLFERSDLIQKRIEELARLLLDGIQRRHSATNTYSGGDRPIVFVASCLGGVILMKALVMADHEYRFLRRATRAIIFLATPFGGTSFQDVARWAEPGLKAWALMRGRKVSTLLQSVKGSTFDLDELVRRFTQLCRDEQLDQVMTFYEMGKTNLYHKIFPHLPIPSKQVVNESSAILQMVLDPLPLDRPHKTMNKFPGHEDPDYQKVAGKLEQFLQGIREGTVLKRADTYIRNEHYTEERLKIERLSGEALPMELCYINLAIVEKPAENSGCSGKGPNKADSASQSSPFSVFARQRVETPDKTIQVELATVFSQRKTGDGREIQPKRILIRGRAGVGKTTLCKRMVYNFVHADRWKELFDRILWVPLRRLKIQPSGGWNLENLFYHEYFNRYLDSNRLAKRLWQELNATKSRRTLFILDGLDEVSGAWDHDDYRSRFLQQLLNQPNVIITSRPSAALPASVDAVDLELETMGFYPDQVEDYIANAFRGPQTTATDPKKVDDVQIFLRRHWLIQGLVRIPIQLDALCYTWDDLEPGDVPDTMTGMYKVIELKLWKKDVLRLGKKHGSEELTKKDIQAASRRTIKGFVKDEMTFLESLAFTGLHNDVIDFTSEHLDHISCHFTPGLLPDRTMPSLSFLRTADSSSEYHNRNYHFIHLTFQEYFAARYFVQQWKDQRGQLQFLALGRKKTRTKTKTSRPAEFLRKHKYTARYDVFWRFVAGLLDATQQASSFIDLIEKEPLDLLGPTHQRLAMHCLSEISHDLHIRKILEARLSQWLLFELDLTGFSFFASESEYPEESIFTALKTDSGKIRNGVLLALQHRGANLSETAMAALTSLLQDEDVQVRSSAARALGGQSNLSDAAITTLTALLQDEDVQVRSSAAQALGGQSNLSDAAITTLTALLQHEQWSVQYSTARALGGQSNLSDEAITPLVALLRHEEWSVRYSSARALRGQSNLSDTVITALTALLRDEDWRVLIAAARALYGQAKLSDAAITELIPLLRHEDLHIRSAVAEALEGHSNLSDAAITALTALLQDEDWQVRYPAAAALGGRSNLSEAAIATLIELLKDEDDYVRSYAAETLGGQSDLSDAAMTALTALLLDKVVHVRSGAAQALGGQSNLLDAAISTLIELLKDKDKYVRSYSAQALYGQSNLSDAAITDLIPLLQHEDVQVRSNAARTLSGQSNLSEPAITALTALLQDEDWQVRYPAAEALGGHSNLSDAAMIELTALLQDEYWQVRSAAAQALGGQSNLSEVVITALTALLQDEEWGVRSTAARALGGQANLLDKILDAMGLLLEFELPTKFLSSTFRHSQFLKPWYGSLLCRSFREQLSLYVDGGTCIINRPSGLRTASIEENDADNQFRTTLGDGRQLWNINGYKLWDNFGDVSA